MSEKIKFLVEESPENYSIEKSKIPYRFLHPIPSYFKDNGWFKPCKDLSHLKRRAFLSWAFEKCSQNSSTVFHDGIEIHLEPYEFICGRKTGSEEIGLTEKEFRGQLDSYISAGLLEKTANSRANRFTCYKWVTACFSECKGQLKGQPRANRGPTEGHKQEHIIYPKEQQQQEQRSAAVAASFSNSSFDSLPQNPNPTKSNTHESQSKAYKSPEKTTSDNTDCDANQERFQSNSNQTTPLTEDLKPETYKCIELLAVPLDFKKKITKDFTEKHVLHALTYCRGRKPKKSYEAMFRWACETQPSLELSKDERIEKNCLYARSLENIFEEKYIQQGYKLMSFCALKECCQFVSGSHTQSVKYDMSLEEFKKEVWKNFEKRGIMRNVK